MTPLLAETVSSGLRWHSLPAAWVLFLVVLPLAALLGWWAYQRERDVPPRARALLSSLRAGALLLFALLVFGPYAELSETRVVRSHLIVLLDASQSMATIDGYEPEDARALAEAAGVTPQQVSQMNRLDLARRVVANPRHGLLEKLTEDFRLHVFTFGSQLTPVVSTGDTVERETPETEPPAARVRTRIGEVVPTESSTRMAQGVAMVLDAFRLRDEPVAGIVVVSDGQENGTGVSLAEAGRRAGGQHVPIYAIGVGDPRSPRNISVHNLRAKEVVLARDTTVFEFSVDARGFGARPVAVELERLDEDGRASERLPIQPATLLLDGREEPQQVRVQHQFLRSGTYSLRLGIPVQPEEKIKSDNYVHHTLRVIDRKIKVLYVEGTPRWEWGYLANALIRDRDTMLAHILLFDADPDTPQRRTASPEWPALDATRGLPPRERLFDYDVIVLGDADWADLAPTSEGALEALGNLRDFVDKGGGLILLSGARHNPSRYKETALAPLIPVVVDRAAERADPGTDPAGFHFRVTPEGERSPLMNVTGDAEPQSSKDLWERHPDWRQYWSYPAQRAKTLAKVLAVSGDPRHDTRFGQRPLIATMPYGRGRVLYIGVDELWRMRRDVADRYFYRFYGEAVRFLATYKLLGGNKRFKILTDRDAYTLDEPVRITLDVLDRDYEPSKEGSHTVKLDMPGPRQGARETVDIIVAADPEAPGTYRRTIVPTRPGDYRLTARTEDPEDQQPEKLFRVVASTVEGRDLLLDEAALRDLADASDSGRYLHLRELPSLRPVSREKHVPTDVRPDELWDSAWVLAAAVLLLSAEWLLRKRWHLV